MPSWLDCLSMSQKTGEVICKVFANRRRGGTKQLINVQLRYNLIVDLEQQPEPIALPGQLPLVRLCGHRWQLRSPRATPTCDETEVMSSTSSGLNFSPCAIPNVKAPSFLPGISRLERCTHCAGCQAWLATPVGESLKALPEGRECISVFVRQALFQQHSPHAGPQYRFRLDKLPNLGQML